MELVETQKKVVFAAVVLIACLAMMNWITWVMIENFYQFFIGVINRIEIDPTYAVVLPLVIGCSSMNLLTLLILFKLATGEKYKKQVEKGARACFIGCLVASGSMFTNPLIHYGLNHFATKYGYHVCDNSRSWKWLMFRTEYQLNSKECTKNPF